MCRMEMRANGKSSADDGGDDDDDTHTHTYARCTRSQHQKPKPCCMDAWMHTHIIRKQSSAVLFQWKF